MPKNNNIKLTRTQVKVIRDFVPPPDAEVTTYYQGENFIDVRYSKNPFVATIKRIDKNWYYVIKTDEYKEYDRMNEDAQKKAKISALQRTFGELRMLIRTNFTDCSDSQLFITLTYAQKDREKPTHKELYADFKKFMMRLKTHYKQYDFEYIVVFEPQGNGWFHCHMMLKTTNQNKLFLPWEVVQKIWGLGTVDVEHLQSTDVGTYYVAYFTDLLLEENASDKSKARVKGGRLQYYPKGMRFYRCSRGIERPTKQTELLERIPKEFYKVHEISYQIDNINELTGEMKPINTHYKATYKRKE